MTQAEFVLSIAQSIQEIDMQYYRIGDALMGLIGVPGTEIKELKVKPNPSNIIEYRATTTIEHANPIENIHNLEDMEGIGKILKDFRYIANEKTAGGEYHFRLPINRVKKLLTIY